MITVQEASEIILSHSQDFGVEAIDFMESQGRILKETILADRDFPPFDRVCMDGIAITEKAFLEGIRSYKIEEVQAAGSPQKVLADSKNCLEVMTGAVLPKNADVVIPYELVTIKEGVATVAVEAVKNLQNIHVKGKDQKEGTVLISEGVKITAAEIGILATVGKFKVKVAKQPKVMIISTGDELVEVSEQPLVHQIRRSNVYSLVALLKELQVAADIAHLQDDKESLKANISVFLKEYDVLLFSGAVSKGKFDFIPEVLDELGVEKLFHKVKQRPGKPFWFGKQDHLEGKDSENKATTIFAFPGNPVSTYVNCLKYFYPWYQKSMEGRNKELLKARLATDFTFKPSMEYFLQVTLEHVNGELLATPVAGNGSGDLANLVIADAFIQLPLEQTEFKKGEVFSVLKYRDL